MADPVLTVKMLQVLAERNGRKTWDIFCMATHFAPVEIQNSVFSSIFANPSELREAIDSLKRLSLVQSSDESSFSITDKTRSMFKLYLRKEETEGILKQAVSLLVESNFLDYIDYESAYMKALTYPSLLQDFCKTPGRLLFGILRAHEFQLAYEFGFVCYGYLKRNHKEFDRAATDLGTFMDLALLAMGKTTEEAKTMIKEIQESSQALGDEASGSLLKVARNVLQSDPCGIRNRETRLRRIVFLAGSVSDAYDDSLLEKWVLYSESLLRFQMTEDALTILDEVIERGCILRFQRMTEHYISNFDERSPIIYKGSDVLRFANFVKARVLMKVGRLQEAVGILDDILAERGAREPTNLKTLALQMEIGKAMKMDKKYNAAINEFEKIATHVKHTAGETNELFLEAKECMVAIYKLRCDLKRAFVLCSDLTSATESSHGIFHPKTCDFKFSLGEILIDMGRHGEAQVIFQELLGIAKKSFANRHDIGCLEMKLVSVANA